MNEHMSEQDLLELVGDQLADERKSVLTAHLEACAECRGAFNEYRYIHALETSVSHERYQAGSDFAVKVMHEVEGCKSYGRRRLEMIDKVKDSWLFGMQKLAGAAVSVVLVLMISLTAVKFLGHRVSSQFSNVANSIGDGGGGYYDTAPMHREHVPPAPPPQTYSYQNSQPAAAPAASSQERYGSYQEGAPVLVRRNPVSTFSLDVDTGSYTNMRRYVLQGTLPPKDSVRVEEFINYFDYNYTAPSDGAFAVSYEAGPSPLEKGRYLLKLGVKARESAKHDEVGWNLVFLVDVSGSMDLDDKIGLIKRSLHLLINKMQPNDRVAIVTYADSSRVVLDSTPGDRKVEIAAAIDQLRAGGSTNGAAGIDLAYQIAESHLQRGGVNRVILATDGDFNVGNYSFSGLMRLIAEKKQRGITLTTLGFGSGNLNEQNLEQLADKGQGNYFYIDSYRAARKVLDTGLAGNMEVVAKDVKLQVEFNPEYVAEYRLIGYDNRALAFEDFKNDKVDGGGVGAGHTVTALYELVLANTPLSREVQEQLRYKQEQGKAEEVKAPASPELAYVKIRCKEPDGVKSTEVSFPIPASALIPDVKQTSADFRFAAAVSGFGQRLRESQYGGLASLPEIAQLAREAKGEDPYGYRQEFIELVQDAASFAR